MARRPLSVAFLTSARAWRGSGVSLSHVAHGLSQRGHLVHMLAGENSVIQEFVSRGLPATMVPTGETGIQGARAIARVLRKLHADCLLVDRPRDLRLGALALLAHPLVLVNRYNLSRAGPPRDVLSRLAYWGVRLTIFVSETNARQALARGRYLRRRPYQIIPEGVDPAFKPDQSRASEFRTRYGIGGEFLLAVGSLTADKRYDFLFEVLRRLGPGAPPLIICGAGPLAGRLQEQAASLHLDVRFLGLVNTELLPGAYTAATAFVHACEIETFGLSVLEAMACGSAVIAANGGAVPEVVGDAGVLTAIGDANSFCGALRSVLSDYELRESLSQAARLRARRFSLSEMQQAYGEAIERITDGAAVTPDP
jgi:glycosyltransferase involved in cell wall biosynthesis